MEQHDGRRELREFFAKLALSEAEQQTVADIAGRLTNIAFQECDAARAAGTPVSAHMLSSAFAIMLKANEINRERMFRDT